MQAISMIDARTQLRIGARKFLLQAVQLAQQIKLALLLSRELAVTITDQLVGGLSLLES
jgi:hypothetical protein